MTDNNNYNNKIELITKYLNEIHKKQKKHYNKYRKYRKLHILCNTSINVLNAVCVSSLVLSFTPVSPITLIIALTFGASSSILSAMDGVINLSNKSILNQTSYLEYINLYRYTKNLLYKNNLNSIELDRILNELNDKVTIIDNHCEPLTSESDN